MAASAIGWDPKEMGTQPITVWEPLRRLQTASEMPSADGNTVRLAVDYYLEAHGGRVRVRLVNSGSPSLSSCQRGTTRSSSLNAKG